MENIKNECSNIIRDILIDIEIELSKDNQEILMQKRLKIKEELEKIILVEVPTQIYSELRQIFIYLFERSGFREVKINETVDFQKLYNMKKFQ